MVEVAPDFTNEVFQGMFVVITSAEIAKRTEGVNRLSFGQQVRHKASRIVGAPPLNINGLDFKMRYGELLESILG